MGFNPYGIIIALAVLAGMGWTAREFKNAGKDPEMVLDALPWVLVFGVIGARLYHVVHLWAYYSTDLIRVLAVWNGGLGIYGGIVGGIVGLGGFSLFSNLKSTTQISKISLFNWLNLAAPGLVLGQAIGRVGNIANRELLPFAAYEMVWDLVIFLVLVTRHKFVIFFNPTASGSTHPASTFGSLNPKKCSDASAPCGSRDTFTFYLILYAFGRFFLEFLRTDNVWRFGALTVAQAVSSGIITITLILVLLRKRHFYPLADK